MRFGIVGLSLGGKTALFEGLTGGHGARAGHGAQHGVVGVPEHRLERVAGIIGSKRATPAHLEFADTAGLNPDSNQAATYNDRILGEIRDMDGLVLVARLFAKESVPHPLGTVDPVRDVERVLLDLWTSDLLVAEKRLKKIEQSLPKCSKPERESYAAEQAILRTLTRALEEGTPPDLSGFSDKEILTVKGYEFFALKPTLVVANVADLTHQDERKALDKLMQWAKSSHTVTIAVNAALEKELLDFPPDERADYYREMGLPGSALDSVVGAAYQVMDLISFFTASEKETRGWPIPRETKAPSAAGKVHTDMEEGFIRAEVVSFVDLDRCGSMTEAKKQGLVRLEGKDYVVRDGDVVFFHFSP